MMTRACRETQQPVASVSSFRCRQVGGRRMNGELESISLIQSVRELIDERTLESKMGNVSKPTSFLTELQQRPDGNVLKSD